jgi:hypothetical protein
MSWRTVVLILVALGLAVLALCTWGSVGSAVCILCLITMGSALLVKRFLINRDESPFDSE